MAVEPKARVDAPSLLFGWAVRHRQTLDLAKKIQPHVEIKLFVGEEYVQYQEQ